MSCSFNPVGTLNRAMLSEWAYNEVKEMHAKCEMSRGCEIPTGYVLSLLVSSQVGIKLKEVEPVSPMVFLLSNAFSLVFSFSKERNFS